MDKVVVARMRGGWRVLSYRTDRMFPTLEEAMEYSYAVADRQGNRNAAVA